MIVYETFLNGRRLCTAGAPGYGVLGVNLTWVKRDPAGASKEMPRSACDVEEHTLQVGGLFGDEHLDWTRSRRIRAGDVIRIRVQRRATADEPVRRKPVEPRQGLSGKKADLARWERYVEHLRREVEAWERRERASDVPRTKARSIRRPRGGPSGTAGKTSRAPVRQRKK